jgi:heptosyltransferase-2
MAIPFAHAWMKHHEAKRRIVVIDPSLKEVIALCCFPADIWSYAKEERSKLVLRLQEEKPSSVTMLTNSLGSIMPYYKAGIPRRIGYGGSMTRWLFNERGPRSQLSRPQGERWFALIGQEPDSQVPPLISSDWDAKATPELLIFPGAKYGPAKQWSHESYAKVADMARMNGWKVCLMGTPNEKKDADAIQAFLDEPVEDLCGHFKLGELLEHLSTLNNPLVLANDSGAMHLLAGAGIPTLGLYFSTSVANTPPAFGPAKTLEADMVCRPCFARECPKGHYGCRDKITPQQVQEGLQNLLKAQGHSKIIK